MELPIDLTMEILRRVPVKSLARFIVICKSWESSIRSPAFIRSFPATSQPRNLWALSETPAVGDKYEDFFLFVCSSSSTEFIPRRLSCPFDYHILQETCFYYLNRLLCFGYGKNLVLYNPSTGKGINVPKVKTARKLIKSFFGYSSEHDNFKILSMTQKCRGDHKDPSAQHQVFTMGSKTWKLISCDTDHPPITNGICIEDAIYYGAQTGVTMSTLILMKFSVKNDTLVVASTLPPAIPIARLVASGVLMNFQGEVSVAFKMSLNTFEVWTLNQGTNQWAKTTTLDIEPWRKNIVGNVSLRGLTNAGDFIFTSWGDSNDLNIYSYNLDTATFSGTRINLLHYRDELMSFYRGSSVYNMMGSAASWVCLDYEESARLL